MEVLEEAEAQGECIGPAEISKRAGVYNARGGDDAPVSGGNDYVVLGVLNSLFANGLIDACKQPNGNRGWKLSSQEG